MHPVHTALILYPIPAGRAGSNTFQVPWIAGSEEATTGVGGDVKVNPAGPAKVTVIEAPGVAVPKTEDC